MEEFQGDNIEIDGEMYMGTTGLWALITGRNPKEYSYEYKDLLYETNELVILEIINQKKWKEIIPPIWEDFQREGIMSDDDEEYHSNIVGDGLCVCIYRKMVAVSIFVVSVMEYISRHVVSTFV